MAPSAGSLHALVAKNARLLRLAWSKATRTIQNHISSTTRPGQTELQPLYARNTQKQPIHPAAFLRQSKGRWYTTHSAINASKRYFSTGKASGAGFSRASLPKSRVGAAVNAFTGRAPFASTLRPNLTGGTFARTAGGYGLGSGRVGGARFFSHTPAAPAQIVQNVSQAVRAFAVGGNKVRFDGVDPRTGEKKFKSVSSLQDKVESKTGGFSKFSPGSYIDFQVNPTITALSPIGALAGFGARNTTQQSLCAEGLLDVLAVDFSRALKDLAIVLSDLTKLSKLGDLPITYRSSYIRVHFPGCDSDTVEDLCDELGIRRGIVGQDEEFDAFAGTEMALLFPFAPHKSVSECSFYEKAVDERMYPQAPLDYCDFELFDHTPTRSRHYSTQSNSGLEQEDEYVQNPWRYSPQSGYDSLHTSDIESADGLFEQQPDTHTHSHTHSSAEYQGIEGIYKFIEQCDAARR